MIKTVDDLRRALEAYPDDMPVMVDGDNDYGPAYLYLDLCDEPLNPNLYRRVMQGVGEDGKYLCVFGYWVAG